LAAPLAHLPVWIKGWIEVPTFRPLGIALDRDMRYNS